MKQIARILVVLALSIVVWAASAALLCPLTIVLAVLNPKRAIRILVGIDCAWSASFGGNGYTSISRRAYLAQKRGERWGCVLCKWLDEVDPGHCARS